MCFVCFFVVLCCFFLVVKFFFCFFFFFQAEDGIRDLIVTGVQTCALPIFPNVGCARPTRTALSHLTSGSQQQKLDHWFDPSVFTKGSSTDFGYGNDSRKIGRASCRERV